MDYLLFVLYLILFAWLVTKTKFFLASGLTKPQLVILFLLKVIMGIFYGWIGLYYGGLAAMLDTWGFHYNALIEYRLLGDNPKEYFTNLFTNTRGAGNFFGSTDSYWNDLKGSVFIKMISIFDIFSFGHYYVNVIIYSFLTLFGPVALYRVMIDRFPKFKLQVLVSCFLIPSFLYWSSGIHKEGLIFVAIAVIIYHLYFAHKEKRYSLKRILGIFLGFVLLLFMRNFLIVIMVPALLAWVLAEKWPGKGLACFSAVYLFFMIIFFTLRYAHPRFDFPQAVVNKQQAFRQIVGNSTITIKELKPNAASFLANTPQALTLSMLRPYPGDVHHLLSLAAALETYLILLLFVLALLLKRKDIGPTSNLSYFCIFFCVTLLLSVGFSVNNLGAIVRYRSVVLPLLVVLMTVRIDWKRIGGFFLKNITADR